MSQGDRLGNLDQALRAYRTLRKEGYAPFCPQLTFLIADLIPGSHEDWLSIDLPWVEKADGVLRLPGPSIGAHMEVEHANKNGVPVFCCMIDLLDYFGDQK